jgi:hypothetical protein
MKRINQVVSYGKSPLASHSGDVPQEFQTQQPVDQRPVSQGENRLEGVEREPQFSPPPIMYRPGVEYNSKELYTYLPREELFKKGAFVNVELEPDTGTALVTPRRPGENFTQRIQGMRRMYEVASEIPGIRIPKIVQVGLDPDFYRVELAYGIPLEITGEDTDEDRRANLERESLFWGLSTSEKLYGTYRYIQFVAALNKEGYVYGDHKQDQVLIWPDDESEGGIVVWVIDPSEVGKAKYSSWEDVKQKEFGGKIDDKGLRRGVSEVMQSFFSLGTEVDKEGDLSATRNDVLYIPEMVRKAARDIARNAPDTVNTMRVYLRVELSLCLGVRITDDKLGNYVRSPDISKRMNKYERARIARLGELIRSIDYLSKR